MHIATFFVYYNFVLLISLANVVNFSPFICVFSTVEEWDHYCHQDQHEEIHEQIVCALEGVTRCALCRSGLEAMCGTLHDIQTCRCSSCLSGIWHLFQPTLHNL